jgi:hypothetical protein
MISTAADSYPKVFNALTFLVCILKNPLTQSTGNRDNITCGRWEEQKDNKQGLVVCSETCNKPDKDENSSNFTPI